MSIEDVLFDHNIKTGGFVRSVNGKQGNVIITREEVGAAAAVHKHEVADVNGLQSSLELLDTTKTYLTDMNRKSVTLAEGTHVVTSETSALVDVEIEGRTLTSLANSNLEALKYYVLADKKTKLIVDNATVAGVGKFQKKSTTFTVADFAGKISTSFTANPHVAMAAGNGDASYAPSVYAYELTTNDIGAISTLNGSTYATQATGAGKQPVHLFSFNLIEQIERQLGLIPKTTIAEKAQWIRENANSLFMSWHGYGTSHLGNKSTLATWTPTTSSWYSTFSASLGTQSVITRQRIGMNGSFLGDDGILHFAAYGEKSDGVTVSRLITDYASLDIELKPTAQLNTRGKIIRVENFEGKIAGSLIENPHKFMGNTSNSAPIPPQVFSYEHPTSEYEKISKMDASLRDFRTSTNGTIAQLLFSFNLIEAVERNVGKIPAATTIGKVNWLVQNLTRFYVEWNGHGSSPLGASATFAIWEHAANTWSALRRTVLGSTVAVGSFNTTSFVAPQSFANINGQLITADGHMHFLAYASASDGVTPSVINTDYVAMELEIKNDANFAAPRVPLYEVTKENYDKVKVTWTDDEVVRRYPAVEGTQHLVNPYVMIEGENLLPPFTEWVQQSSFRIESPYKVIMNAAAVGNQISYSQVVIPNTIYTLSVGELGDRLIYILGVRSDGSVVNLPTIVQSTLSVTFTTPADISLIRILPSSIAAGLNKDIPFSNIILNFGNSKKPFVPRNPSYLFTSAKLGSLVEKKDQLLQQDGQWKLRRVIEKDLLLDGLTRWEYNSDYTGVKRFISMETVGKAPATSSELRLLKSDGALVPYASTIIGVSDTAQIASNGILHVNVSDSETGFGDSYVPSTSDAKRFFNGWKYSNGTTWTSVTGNGQTATAQVALDTKPTDYTPYKLSYVLAAPVIEDVNVEGELKVDGMSQIEISSGIIVREKINPVLAGANFFVNGSSLTSKLSFKNRKFITVFKNGVRDEKWQFILHDAAGQSTYGGLYYAKIAQADFDTTAVYTMTYLAEKTKLTNAPTNTKLTYANSIRASFQDAVTNLEDTATQVSVDSKFLLDVLVQLKALRG